MGVKDHFINQKNFNNNIYIYILLEKGHQKYAI